MKHVALTFWGGMLGSFVLGWALFLLVISGNGRHLFRLMDQFVREEPLQVAPDRFIRIPGTNGR